VSRPQSIDLETLRGWGPPRLTPDGDKETRGQLLVIAGGGEVAGAAILAGVAGLRVGAGKLQMAAPAALAVPLALAVPEARVLAVPEADGEIGANAAQALKGQLAAAEAVVIGPGMMDEGVAGGLAERAIAAASGAAFVVDAAAFTGLAGRLEAARAAGGRLVVTPHAGEMAALTGKSKAQVQSDPLAMAREAAAALQAVVVMKGAETFVVSPDGRAWSHRAELPGLGASGSGDVLAGVIGGLLARGASPLGAAAWGVCLHAHAGARLSERIGRVGFLARELLDELAGALEALGAACRTGGPARGNP